MSDSNLVLSKMRWRCRRGMRELDALMLGWLDKYYEDADDELRLQFQEILAMQDPEIIDLMKDKLSSRPENQLVEKKPLEIPGKDTRYDELVRQICQAQTE